MSDNLGRFFGACVVLAVLWVVVYWWWQPAQPQIRFDAERPTKVATTDDQPQPPSQIQGQPQPRERARTAPRQPEQREIAVIPPAFRQYTVRRGDTLSRIASRELGSARHAEAISRANPYVNFEQIREGRTILIPLDPGNIQGLPVDETQPSPKPEPTTPDQPMAEYTVQPGDTLSRIAQAHYGSVRYADLIFDANRDRMRTMDQLSVGQKLRLPPKPD